MSHDTQTKAVAHTPEQLTARFSDTAACALWAILGCFLILLSACESTPPAGLPDQRPKTVEALRKAPIKNVSEALRRANISQEPVASQLRATATRLAINTGDLEQARRIIATILEPRLTGQSRVDYLLTKSQLLLLNGSPNDALNLLDKNSFRGMILAIFLNRWPRCP